MDPVDKQVAVQFGENLRAFRRRAAISQEILGQRASLHRTEIGLLERGERLPRIDTLIKLTNALSISPAEILVGIRPPNDVHESSVDSPLPRQSS